ncbi:MAG: hypothetical protein H7256_08150 [Bdellovibrio sp.]|nr:hypothetical protein [Bdellovibrio sp.]
MRDGSRNFSGLREEWSLLVHSIIDDNSADEKLQTANIQELSLEQIKILKRDLSEQRKNLNVAIEQIKSRIDRAFTVLENLELVGSDPEDTQDEIEKLNQQGAKVSGQIATLDKQLNKIHELTDKLIQLQDQSA